MPIHKNILIVDDHEINRRILSRILSEEYRVLWAENGSAAINLLNEHPTDISAVLLDIVMPVMDGYAFLKYVHNDPRYQNLPILVATENNDTKNEIKVLALGAWDFISKPYNAEIIRFRLKNAIDRSQLSAFTQLKYLAEYDSLTGIYNKSQFFAATSKMIQANSEQHFAFLRLDIDRFQLINSFFGIEEGDRILVFIAERLQSFAYTQLDSTCGRIGSDVFCLCMPYDEEATENLIHEIRTQLSQYNPNYDIVPSIGIYIVNDLSVSVEMMYNRAALAAKTCKGSYVDYYAYYNENMSVTLAREQEIVNEMNFALENHQFEIYLQPKYHVQTTLPCGAEALVRWNHPQKGLLMPGEFISIFERNGFITKLDPYIWERACQCLHGWIEQGRTPQPISVNISRVNVYNPQLVDILIELVNRYEIDPSLLQLELTESAYTDNPIVMSATIARLQSFGFTILMDDFGNGYSSLSILKDIAVDVLKIDMRFLSQSTIPGRGENIIASVIRMAKWLNIPVVTEGVETLAQVEFLKSVGCEYIQGYYFARPMPLQKYEELFINQESAPKSLMDKKEASDLCDKLFSSNPQMQELFNNSNQATAVCEFFEDRVEFVRVNDVFYNLLKRKDTTLEHIKPLDFTLEKDRETFLATFRTCAETESATECECAHIGSNGDSLWLHISLEYMTKVEKKHIVLMKLTDITTRKEIDLELQKYRASLLSDHNDAHTILIVDDGAINRRILKKIFENKFTCLEAENGEEAIAVLQENPGEVDLILLDIMMPKMDGKEFLQYKKDTPKLDSIPVIMITADDSPEQQINTLSLGANDYVVKPFIPEVVIRRVRNVLQYNRRFKEIIKEYNNMSEQIKTDLMTGLYNRVSAEVLITQRLESNIGLHAMLMLDVDNFKKLNDSYGHDYGDRVIRAIAQKLRSLFRENDIVTRMGGDEFSVFMGNIPSVDVVERKARELCQKMSAFKVEGENAVITCSVGVAISSCDADTFSILYKRADKALYNAKCQGKNMLSIYGKELPETAPDWIHDSETVLNEINDIIYICKKDTHEMLYMNEYAYRFFGVTREECMSRKCYEVLLKQSAPCTFCPIANLSEERVYGRLFRLPQTSHLFLMRGKEMTWNGIAAHLEVAVEMNEIKNMELFSEEAINNGEQ